LLYYSIFCANPPAFSEESRAYEVPAIPRHRLELHPRNLFTQREAAKAVVRRNTEEVQSSGNVDVFEELFADDFIDHTPQSGTTPEKEGVSKIYGYIRAAFPDFYAEIHWQLAGGDRVTTYKTYHGTHEGHFLGVAPTHRNIQFETVDVMRVSSWPSLISRHRAFAAQERWDPLVYDNITVRLPRDRRRESTVYAKDTFSGSRECQPSSAAAGRLTLARRR
jgi:predicted ester cyclase